MKRREAFLLTRQWRDTDSGIDLEFWLASDTGPLRVIINQQEAVFFVLAADAAEILRSLATQFSSQQFRLGNASLRNWQNQSVLPVYFSSFRAARDAADLLTAEHIPYWEADIRPPERFLMERFITGGVQLHLDASAALSQPIVPANPSANSNSDSSSSLNTYRNIRLTPAEYRPSLRLCSLDIETSRDAKALYSIAVYTEQTHRIFMVGTAAASDLDIVNCKNQRDCLQQFLAWVAKEDPDIFIGWSIVQFDLWVLESLCQKERLPFSLGRAGQTPHWREDSDRERRYIQIPGRVALDGIELLRAASYSFTSFSLENVARQLLGEGKLAHGSERVEDITQWFLHDKAMLAAYNLKDCALVWDIFAQERLIAFALERSQLTGLALDRSGGSVAAFEYAYLPLLHRKGYVAPNLGEIESDVVSPGGYVMDSRPGIFNNVLVLDFKSLYPSIIRTFKIDPYGYWAAQHQQLTGDNLVPGFNEARFAKHDSILPGVIERLWVARDAAKAEKNQPLNQAIKIIMNSFYGVLGSPGCRFFDPRVCSSITLRGHDIIQTSKRWIEEQGYEVIYGDTDSVFVWVGDAPAQDPASIGKLLAQRLNSAWQKRLHSEFAIESALEIQFETHYLKFLMPTIRNSTEGSKKRYAGLVEKNGQQQIVFKGLENVRTDWTSLAKVFQEALYQKVFAGEAVEQYVRETVRKVFAGELDGELIYRKRLRRRLDEYSKNIPPHVQAAKKLQQAQKISTQRGEWIEYYITVNGPEPVGALSSLIDYHHYVDKQLAPIADSLLQFINLSFVDISAPQRDLFG